MGIRYYDEAITNKIKSWVKDQNMSILKPEETKRLFMQKLDENNDKPIKLPLIAISRESDIEILSTNKKPLTFDGATADRNIEKTQMLNAIPIHVKYQLDIYTRYFEEADEYVRNFVFQFINNPKLKIEIPYNDSNIEHISNVRMASTVEDNSDIAQRLLPDQFTRFTFKLYIDDAYLFSVPIKENVRVNGDIEIEIVDVETINIE